MRTERILKDFDRWGGKDRKPRRRLERDSMNGGKKEQRNKPVLQKAEGSRLAEEAVADDAPERLYAVFPGDFFAFFVSAAGVRDGDFVDAPVPFCDFGGDFRFEAEAIGF